MFPKILILLKNLKFFRKSQIFRKYLNFPKISKFSKNIKILPKYLFKSLILTLSMSSRGWSQPFLAKTHQIFLCGCLETVKTSLMYPWLVRIASLKSPQGSPGRLQSLRKSYISYIEISFWYIKECPIRKESSVCHLLLLNLASSIWAQVCSHDLSNMF